MFNTHPTNTQQNQIIRMEIAPLVAQQQQINNLLQTLTIAKRLVHNSQGLLSTVIEKLKARLEYILNISADFNYYQDELKIAAQLMSLIVKNGKLVQNELNLSRKIREIAENYVLDLLNQCAVLVLPTEPKLYKLSKIIEQLPWANQMYVRYEDKLYFFNKEHYSLEIISNDVTAMASFDRAVNSARKALIEKQPRVLTTNELESIQTIARNHLEIDTKKIYIKLPAEPTGLLYQIKDINGTVQQTIVPWNKFPRNINRDMINLEELLPYLQIIEEEARKNGHVPHL